MSTAKVKTAAKAAQAAAPETVDAVAPAAVEIAAPAAVEIAAPAALEIAAPRLVSAEVSSLVPASVEAMVSAMNGQLRDSVAALTGGQTGSAAALRSYEDAVQIAKDNLDAVVQSGTIVSKGLQDIGQSMAALSRTAVEECVAASQALLSAKTLRDLVDLQTGLARSTFDRFLADGSRLQDQSVKLFEQALAPIALRVNATVDKMVKSAA